MTKSRSTHLPIYVGILVCFVDGVSDRVGCGLFGNVALSGWERHGGGNDGLMLVEVGEGFK